MKVGKMLLIKLVSNYFSGNSYWVLGPFSKKIWKSTNLRKLSFWTNFVTIVFRKMSANCRWMIGIFSFLAYNKLFINRIARAVPWNTKPSFFYPRTSQAQTVLQNLGPSISRYGPCIWLIISHYWPCYAGISLTHPPRGFCTEMCAQPQGFCTTENARGSGQ